MTMEPDEVQQQDLELNENDILEIIDVGDNNDGMSSFLLFTWLFMGGQDG